MVVWTNVFVGVQGSNLGNFQWNYQIEGEEHAHTINCSVFNNQIIDVPLVPCKEEINEDGTSSFFISSNNITKNIYPNENDEFHWLTVFSAKNLSYCVQYDDSLQFCIKCTNDAFLSTNSLNESICIKLVKNCIHYNNDSGICLECQTQNQLIDENGYITYSKTNGLLCVQQIYDCFQYDITVVDFPCFKCLKTNESPENSCFLKILTRSLISVHPVQLVSY